VSAPRHFSGIAIVPEQTVRAFLQAQLPQAPGLRCLVLGLSGGLDSTVLLHVLQKVAGEFALALRAVHVHHGLSPYADAWAKKVAALCDALQVPLEIHRVQVAQEPSLEGAARSARYAAFAESLKAGEALVLAQHRDDQAETLLFRLVRGAGVKGLGAMRGASRLRIGARLAVPQWRPLLSLPRSVLQDYARMQGLQWIEDESNRDIRYDRNYLRLEVLPRLQARWPGVKDTLAATAARLQEADALLQELAAELATDGIDAAGRLSLAVLQPLSLPRQKLLLRYWLQQQAFLLPDEAVLSRVIGDVVQAREDAMPRLAWAGCELRRYRTHLYAMKPLAVIPRDWEAEWSGEAPLALPDGRRLILEGAAAPERPWRVRYRRGGERYRAAPEQSSRDLKNLLQEAGVPPWERERLPLVFEDGQLIAVPGLMLPGESRARRFVLGDAE
jgi:tRNA(Ile)-lysidine synthase